MSGTQTNYLNSMCPASGYVTARKNCGKSICPAPGKMCGSDCVLYIIWPASAYVTVRKSYRKSICPAGALKICRSDCAARGKYAEILIC